MNMLLDLDRKEVETVELSSQRAYWQKQLAGDWPMLTFLMKDLPEDALAEFATTSFSIPDDMLAALDSFAEANGVTGFSTLLATYFVLLARYAAQDEVVVGIPVFAMDTAVNAIPLKVNLAEKPSFVSLVQQVNELVTNGMKHSDIPVAELLQPFGDIALQVQFSMEQTADFGGLALTFAVKNGRLQGTFRYATELFTSEKIDQLTTHFQQLLANGLREPETAVQQIPMLTDQETRQILYEWNNQLIADYQPSNFVSHFEKAAQENADGLAIISDFGQLTYRQLNEKANQLARHLRACGAEAGELIGISMERTPDMIVAMLGVLKSGAAYIPIDPQYPRDRQAFMLEDGNVLAVLTQAKFVDHIPSDKTQIICVDRDWEMIAQQKSANLDIEISPEAIAYVIYTSGSTGKPKGVLIPHKALTNYIQQVTHYYEMSPEDVCLQFSSISFDASVEEIYCPLMSGATLALRNEAMLAVDEFLSKTREWQLTLLPFPTAFWHELVLGLTGRQETLPESVRLIVFGGEKVLPERVVSWQELHGEYPRLLNAYGPTEFTVGATFADVNDYKWKNEELHIHIGRPLANQQVYILDKYLEPVPVGVPGELYLGGVQVAKGYLNRPDLTAERFIANPFYDGPEARLYKTGDLVRYLPDGNIEFMGRADYQVKFRGYRIELGEIEAALNAHTAVYESVVLIYTNQSNIQRLVAYCVTDPDQEVNPTELVEFLSSSLPEYMIPTAYTFLEALPLTPGGKIDRRALPEPVFEGISTLQNYLAPRTKLESELASIWAEILGIEQVGIQDNFFQLGGHSLIAVRMLSRAQKITGYKSRLDVFFANPTIADLAAYFEAESADETDGLAAIETAINLETIPKIERSQSYYAASSSQARIWLHNAVDPDTEIYIIPFELYISGKLDIELFTQAFSKLIARHESLHTTFQMVEGQVRQILRFPEEVSLEVTDISDMAEAERNARLHVIKTEFFHRRLDLEDNSLIAAMLVKVDAAAYHCLINVHHAIADGWSLSIMMRDLGEIYAGLYQGKDAELPELTVQYIDYAAWERATVQGEYEEALLAYWREALDGMPEVLVFPTDFPRPAQQTFAGKTHHFAIPKELEVKLQQFSQAEQVTLYMTMLSAMQVMVYRYCGQDDFAIGSPFAGIGRSFSEMDPLVGCFINMLVLRTQITEGMSYRELLTQTRERVLAADRHQALPFDKLVAELKPSRVNGHPFFQVGFGFEGGALDTLHLSDLEISSLLVNTGISKYDLSLLFGEYDDVLHVGIEYNTELFLPETIERMAGHYLTLLTGLVADPDTAVTKLPMLTEAEKQQLLVEWNDRLVLGYQSSDFVTHFQQRVQENPDNLAVISDFGQLSYEELNARANQLARYLRTKGAGPDRVVGISMERVPEMVIAMLAVLKSGAAYIPIDPKYPLDRQAFMLEDGDVVTLLTQEKFVAQVPAGKAEIFCMDRDWAQIAALESTNLDIPISPDDVAYIIYTSGSTGKPKGVLIPHKGLTNFAQQVNQLLELTPADRCLQFSSISFDSSIVEIYGTLISGAALALRNEAMLEIDHFLAKVEEWQLTILAFPTAFWHELALGLTNGGAQLPESVRVIIFGGEKILPERVASWQAAFGNYPRIINGYGPTEFTVGGTFAEVHGYEWQHGVLQTHIGRPLSNQQAYILDSHMQPVPIGVSGELYLGGIQVAKGYLNRPDLTAERFIENPFYDGPEARLYKTGDLVRYLPDGNIEFMGRADYQVKFRGYRIELGEIEAALNAHTAVQESIVLIHTNESGVQRLAAYCVMDKNEPVRPAELSKYLSLILPDYMVPSACTLLNEFPMTPGGKINRRALPEPKFEHLDTAQSYVAPETELQKTLVEMWQDVLGVERVGIHDDFFNLGGHSLIAVRMLGRVKRITGHTLTLDAFFKKPTIAELADSLEHHSVHEGGVLAAIEEHLISETIPLIERNQEYYDSSSSQANIWLHSELDLNTTLYNTPLELHFAGHVDVPLFEQTLSQMIARHATFRTTFENVDGQVKQCVAAHTATPLEVMDISDVDAELQTGKLEAIRREFFLRPFDLAEGPLLRVLLVQKNAQSWHCLISFHHIIADGWSVPLMMGELGEIYSALQQGRSAQLPELTAEYIDYAAWEQATVQGEYMDALLDYWRKALNGMPQVVDFPTDFPRPAQQTFEGETYYFTIPENLVTQLHQFSQKQKVTLYMTMLSAVQALVYRYSGQLDFAIGSPYAGIGRSFSEMESLVGCFINMLVMRTQLTEEMSYRELLAQTKERVLAGGRRQALPFDKLVEALQPARMNVNPFFQTAFIFEGGQLATLQYPGLEVSSVPVNKEVAIYDLSFYVSDTADGTLQVGMEYNTNLFLPDTIERMAGHYLTLLEGLLANPNEQVSKLPMLTEAERVLLLVDWNETTVTPYPASQCIHQLFEAQVEKTPEAIAVVSGERRLTYQELNQRANQLAHYLQNKNDIQPDQFIGLCVTRNEEMLIGLLGIHKAGAAYLPMDPDYPAERLAYMLEDTQASIILTQQQLKPDLPATNAQIICLDADWSAISQESIFNPTSDVRPYHLAYVIYTSGSTGKPKGVQIPHQAVVNFLWTMKEEPGLTKEDTLIAVTTLSFDIAVLELFLPIVVGAKIVIVERDVAMDAQLLAEAIEIHQATVMQATPATWNMLVSAEWQGAPNLKVLSGGEAISRQLSNDLLDRVGELWNMYGPTETTIWSTIWPIPKGNEHILIGKPIANTDIYILDKNLQPVPIGVPGELHIGGDGVSRGYLNRDELTVERFIPDPFKPDAKIYKTGDLARYRADGNIECLGRLDFQVKVRGFRIELGEIETVLLEHEQVERAVVTAREDGSGGKRLVAYLIAGEAGEVASTDLRAYLGETLPPYMIPSQIVWVDEYPLTPNGKVDRRALPDPGFEQLDLSKSYLAPRSELEAKLADIWMDTLNLGRVGVHDNFFELGGHSLIAVRMMSQIQKKLGHKLTLGVLFQAPTVAELASYLETDAPDNEIWKSLVEIQRGKETQTPFFCVHGAGGNVMNFYHLASYMGANQPFYGLQALGIDGETKPLGSVEEMAAFYLSEIRQMHPHGPYYLGGFSSGGCIAYEMAQQLRSAGERVGAVVLFDTVHPRVEVQSISNADRWDDLREFGVLHLVHRLQAKIQRPIERHNHELRIRYYLKRKRPLPIELRSWYLATVLANVVAQYNPKPYDGRLVMFRAMETPAIYSHVGLDWGWSEVTPNMEIIKMPGTHDTLILEPNVEVAIDCLNQLMKDPIPV